MKIKMSLTRKVATLMTLLLVPLAFFGWLTLSDCWARIARAEAQRANVELFTATSKFIHSVQRERGGSMLFLGGKSDSDALARNREAVELAAAQFQQPLKKVKLTKDDAGFLQDIMASLQGVRRAVDTQGRPTDIISSYSALIERLRGLQVRLARQEIMNDVTADLLGLTNLESAKENAGQFRASTAYALTADAPMDSKQVAFLEKARFGISTALEVPALIVSADGKEELAQVFRGAEYQATVASFDDIISHAKVGKFGRDSSEFYKNISHFIDGMGGVALRELGSIERKAAEIESKANRILFMNSTLIGAVAIFLLLIAWYLIRSLSSSLEFIVADMLVRSNEVSEGAQSVSTTSKSLSSSALEQATALEQTSIAVHEVSAMVARNADNAKTSKQSADVCEQAALQGKESVRSMIQSMTDISESNKNIIERIEAANNDISSIAKVISGIGTKTSIINEIVFQTKLLSFNASVEAARAGDHGKGFSVVAEEIGNLARKSGVAAEEISEILHKGIIQVEHVISATNKSMAELTSIASGKVEIGSRTAIKCGEALDNIVSAVGKVNLMASDIAVASEEQARGVREITAAVQKLGNTTQVNASTSQESSVAAEDLSGQAVGLQAAAMSLAEVVYGDSTRISTGPSNAPSAKFTASAEPSPLIERLVGEHRRFVELFQELARMGIQEPNGLALLNSIKQGWIAHGDLEEAELYPSLRGAAQKDIRLQAKLKAFAQDMEKISEAGNHFFQKYESGGPANEFQTDLSRLVSLLAKRIRREETSLYPEYEAERAA